MPKRSSKRRDTQQLARHVIESMAPDAEPQDDQDNDVPSGEDKNPAAVALGWLGGIWGRARAKKLSQEQRSEIAKKAAQARLKKK